MFSPSRTTTQSSTGRFARRGFTLIELLMVIVIISILITLVAVGFSRASTNVQVARVKAEITGLENALADFKTNFGFYPPSKITLHVNPAGWNSDPESRAVIKRMFPQFDFINASGAGAGGGAPWTNTGPVRLSGPECLVFFLGGVTDSATGTSLNGFSENPLLPFDQAGSNRIGPFFDFDAGRLVDLDTDKMPEYVSPLSNQTMPYLYLSAYNGRGYRCNDLNDPNNSVKQLLQLPAAEFLSVYYQNNYEDYNCNGVLDAGEDLNGNGILDGSTAWKPKSFQIICAGLDDKFGTGGKFDPNTAEQDLGDVDLNGDGDFADPHEAREADRDNITNFHPGMLSP